MSQKTLTKDQLISDFRYATGVKYDTYNDDEIFEVIKNETNLAETFLPPEPTLATKLTEPPKDFVRQAVNFMPAFIAKGVYKISEFGESIPFGDTSVRDYQKAKLKEQYPDRTDEEITEINRQENPPLFEPLSDWANESITEAIKREDELLAKDQQYAGYKAWVQETPFTENYHKPTVLLRAVTNGLPSMMTAYGTGAAVYLGASFATKNPILAGTLSRGAVRTVTGLLEGSSELNEGIRYLMQDKSVSANDFNSDVDNFANQLRDLNLNDTQLNTRISQYIEDNYKKEGDVIIRKGLPSNEASDIVIGSALSTGIGAQYLEGGRTKQMWQAFGSDRMMTSGIFGRIVENVSNGVRRIPKIGASSRLIRGGRPYYKVFTNGAGEAMEEFSQYSWQIANQTLLPMGYKDESFTETFDVDEATEAAVGGFGMGIGSSSVGVFMDKAGIIDKIDNFRKIVRGPGVGEFVVRKDKGSKSWSMYYSDTDGLVKYDADVSDGRETTFGNQKDALEAARILQNDIQDQSDAVKLQNHREYIDADVRIEGKKDGSGFEVNVYDKDGSILDTESFKTKKEATVDADMKTIAVRNLNDIKNKQKQKAESGDIVQDSDQYQDVALRSFIGKRARNENEADNEVSIQRDHNIFEDPKYIESILENRGEQALIDAGIDKQEFLEEIEANDSYDTEKVNKLLTGKPKKDTKQDYGKMPVKEYANLNDASLNEARNYWSDRKDKSEKSGNKMDVTVSQGRIDKLDAEMSRRGIKPTKVETKKPVIKTTTKKDSKPIVPDISKDEIGRDDDPTSVPDEIEQKGTKRDLSNKTDKELSSRVTELNKILETATGAEKLVRSSELKDYQKEVSKREPKSKLGKRLSPEEIKKMTVSKLKKELKGRGIKVKSSDKKADLIKMLKDSDKETTVRKKKKTKTIPIGDDKAKKKLKEFKRRVNVLKKVFKGKVGKNIEYTNDGEGSFIDLRNGNIVLDVSHGLSTAFHEFSHPFFRELRLTNPELFDNLYDDVEKADLRSIFPEINKIRDKYTELNESEKREEVLAFFFEKSADKRFSKDNRFVVAFKKFFKWLKSYLFGKDYAKNIFIADLDANTTMEDLAEMIANQEGKYTIELTDKAFVEMQSSINEDLNVDDSIQSSSIGNSEDVTNKLWTDLSEEIMNVVIDGDGNRADKRVLKYLNPLMKKLKLKKKAYKGKYTTLTGNEKSTELINREVKKLKASIPKGFELSDETIESIKAHMNEMSSQVEFKYKFVDLLKSKNSSQSIGINNIIPMAKNMTKAEKTNINRFVKFLNNRKTGNFAGKKSIPAGELANIYQTWSDNDFPLFFTKSIVPGYESQIKHEHLFDDDIYDRSTGFRNTIHSQQLYDSNSFNQHLFKYPTLNTKYDKDRLEIIEDEGGGQQYIAGVTSGAPIGWYASINLKGNRVFLYEYQSDILRKLDMAYRKAQGKFDVGTNKLQDAIDLAVERLDEEVRFKDGEFLRKLPDEIRLFDIKLEKDGKVYNATYQTLLQGGILKDILKDIGLENIDKSDLQLLTNKYIDPIVNLTVSSEAVQDKAWKDFNKSYIKELEFSAEAYKNVNLPSYTDEFVYMLSLWLIKGGDQSRKELLEFYNYIESNSVTVPNLINNYPNKDSRLYKKIVEKHNTIQNYDGYNERNVLINAKTRLENTLRSHFRYSSDTYDSNIKITTMINNNGSFNDGLQVDSGGWNQPILPSEFKEIKKELGKMRSDINASRLSEDKRRAKILKRMALKEWRINEAKKIGVKEMSELYMKYLVSEGIRHSLAQYKFQSLIEKTIKDTVKEDASANIFKGSIGTEAMNLLGFDNKFFETTILHSINTAFSNGANEVYLNTAAAIADIEAMDNASVLYESPMEGKWMIMKSQLQNLDSEAMIPYQYREKFNKILSDSNLSLSFSLKYPRNLDQVVPLYIEFLENEVANFKNQQAVVAHTKKATKVDVEALFITALNKMNGKPEYPNQSVAQTGKWFKALQKVSKKHNFKLELVQEEGFQRPLWKVIRNNETDFTPYRYKKIIENKQLEEVVPNSESLSIAQAEHRFNENEVIRTQSKLETNRILNDAWRHIKKIGKNNNTTPSIDDFRIAMKDALPLELHDLLQNWFNKEVKKDPNYELKKTAKGKELDVFMDSEDVRANVIDIMDGMEEGLDDIISKRSSDERVVNLGNVAYFHELGILMDIAQMKILHARIPKSKSFDQWAKDNFTLYTKKSLKTLTQRQLRGLKKYYNRVVSSVRTNSEKGAYNERDNYEIDISNKGTRFRLKGPENERTRNQNSQYEKVTLFEYNQQKRLFHFIGKSDVTEPGKALMDEDGKFVYNIKGEKIYPLRQKYDFLNPKFNFFTKELMFDINMLQDNILKKHNLALAFSAGDRSSVALVDVKKEHYDKAKQGRTYWLNQGVSEKQMDNFMGKYMMERANPIQPDAYFLASNIAVYEAMQKVVPGYLDMNGSEVFKRLKIPFTPVTIAREMRDIKVKIFNPKNVAFKTNDREVKAMVNVAGRRLYIGDGGSLTSKSFFKASSEAVGSNPNVGKLKTVIYHKDGDNVLAVKHQHFLPHRGLKIFNGNKEIAYVDQNGDIIDSETNEMIDVLMTPDEAKIYNNYNLDETITLPGTSVGFIMFDERSPSVVKHPMQWYNHVIDPQINQAFKNSILKKVNRKIIELYSVSQGDEAPNKVLKSLQRLASKDTESFYPVVLELAKLGGGLHPALEPMLNVLLQSGPMTEALTMDFNKGTRLHIAPSLDGRLENSNIGIARESAKYVFEKYAEDQDISISDAYKVPNREINAWLKDNPVKAFVSRFPIPHVGGAGIFTVNHIHSRNLLIEATPFDTFALFEGDHDGDELHVEFLDNNVLPIYESFFETIDSKGINLAKWVSEKEQFDLSRRDDRVKLIEALTFGKNAIGEVANAQSAYGQLSQVLDSVTINGSKITLRKPDEIVNFKGQKIEFSEYLRTMMQAAVDNAEFLLLKEWNYSSDKLMSSLFRKEDGVITEDDMAILKPLMNLHKVPRSIMRGQAWSFNYRLDDTMMKSENYYTYTENREQYFKDYVGDTDIQFEIAFKENVTAPVEDIAIAPYKMWAAYTKKFGLIGHDVTPVRLNEILHQNTHMSAVEILDKEHKVKMLRNAIEKDLQGVEASTKDKRDALKGEAVDGVKYVISMANDFYKIINSMRDVGPQTIDRNERMIQWKEKYNTKFNNLSETAKVAATFKFLERWFRAGKFEKIARIFPPVSNSKSEYSLLDHKVVSTYFKEYHSILQKKRELRRREKGPRYEPIENIINKVCK